MKSFSSFLLFALALCISLRAEDAPKPREWIVDGVTRQALVFAPEKAKTENAPLLFAFHGHGGNMQFAARSFAYHQHWPEAIVVYPQGLNTAGLLTDPTGQKPGWQHDVGKEGDRDLKFFDAMLADLKKDYHVDPKRIYVTGHSNGGGFTYTLWAARGDEFAAFAPCAADAQLQMPKLKPKPVLHLAGENDPLVKYAWQQQTIDSLKKLNQCGEGQPSWEGHPECTFYPSKIGAPLVTFIHPGRHNIPAGAEEAIVKFFQSQAKP